MSRYTRDAKYYLEEIEKLHRHGGWWGYAQAERHFFFLTKCAQRAAFSKNDKDDVFVIRPMVEQADQLMLEMKKREDEEHARHPKG